jgi:hypothetical protein
VSAYTDASGWGVAAVTDAGDNTAKYGTNHKRIVITDNPSLLTTVSAVTAYLAGASGGGSAASPVTLPVSLNLAASGGNGWADLLSAIAGANKYVNLDLAACSAGTHSSGGGLYADKTFDPDATNTSTGKGFIVSLVLPTAATSIKASVDYFNPTFQHFTALKSVSGANIGNVGDFAFSYFTGLSSVSFPAATYIRQYAFIACTSLSSVNLPEAITIGTYAFTQCTGLSSVNLPKATDIGEVAFGFCSNLSSVTLLEASSIGANAFANCTGLTTVNLPKAITIGVNAFTSCTSLTTVSLPKATSIGDFAFGNTGVAALTLTLGSAENLTAPTLGMYMFFSVSSTKNVTVKVPSGATGYGTVPETYTETGSYTDNWGNGFRGGGWSSGTMTDSSHVNSNVSLTIEFQ